MSPSRDHASRCKAPSQPPGEIVLDFVAGAGRFALFMARFVAEFPGGLRYRRLILRQCFHIGNESMPLVILTSVFVGGVAALQSSYQFQGAIPLIYVGTVLAKSVFIELGPVLTALVVGARVGASIAAEIGTMKRDRADRRARDPGDPSGPLPRRARASSARS